MEKIMQKPVSEFMTKDVISVSEDESIKKVFNLMDKHGILGVPVVAEDGAVIGIVTESDLVGHFTTLETPRAISILGSIVYLDSILDFNKSLKEHCAEIIKEVMTKEVITIMHNATLLDAINLMDKHKISRLPVVGDKGDLVGIITRSDIVHQIAKLKTI